MDKKCVDRYQQGIERYLKDRGILIRLVKYDWGFSAYVRLEDDYVDFTFEYQGDDEFSVTKKTSVWDEDDYLMDKTENQGFITVK